MLVISVLMTVIASKFVVSCHMLGRLLIILVCVSDFSTSFSSLTPASTSPWASNDLFCNIKTGNDKGKCKEESTSRSGSRNRIDDGFAGSKCKKDKDCNSGFFCNNNDRCEATTSNSGKSASVLFYHVISCVQYKVLTTWLFNLTLVCLIDCPCISYVLT